MNRKRATWVSAALIVVLVLSVITAAVGWGRRHSGAAKNIKLGLDLSGGVSITYQTVGTDEPDAEQMSDTIYKLQQRVQNYSTEASVYQEGSNRINIEIPGVTDANAILEELGKPGSLEFQLEDGTVVLTGGEVVDAHGATQKDQTMGNTEYVVSLEFNDTGKKSFAEATSANVGRQIYIVYDGGVISAPRVNEPITDGKCIISGNFTMESASELASYIRIGSLSLELEEIRSNIVGAQLGQKALSTSLVAGLIGLVIVMIFMIIVYKLPGVIAAIALIFYTALELVLLNAFDMTLTLAGIAGVILSIGMAVDANVIIYARIREEIAAGKTVKSAIDIGFKKALSAIIDGNVTTLIAAIVLNFKGTGTVKGFAQTLMLGIILSMFTACVFSRLLVNAAYELGMKEEKHFGKAKERKTIDFVGKRKLFFAISIIAILIGPASMLINNAAGKGILNLSMEFRGGTSSDIAFDKDYTIDEIDSELKPVIQNIIGDAEIQAQKVAGTNEIIFKTRVLTVEEREKIEDAFAGMMENGNAEAAEAESEAAAEAENEAAEASDAAAGNTISFETISSTISNEMREDAVVAVIVAVILMLIYIWIRFSDFRFASSAVLALCHDVLVVFACYALIRISVGNTFIACMLTIVGYSINATIVIFDRIRENLKLRKKSDELSDIVNRSITQTLTRSIYTSFTTFATVTMLFIMGVPSIREFALPLMVGIIAGGFSSVCITGPLWYMMRTGAEKKIAAEENGKKNKK